MRAERHTSRDGGPPERRGVEVDMRSYELFLDESGRFDGDDDGRPSQLVGIVAPRGEVTPASAEKVLRRCYTAAQLPLPEEVHGTDLRDPVAYTALVHSLVQELEKRNWQPVRCVNRERVDFGDRVETYVQILAELAVRLFGMLSRGSNEKVELHITCASVTLEPSVNGASFIADTAVRAALEVAFKSLAIRRGQAHTLRAWSIPGVQLGSGRRWRTLQLCDLLSNASYDNYRRLDAETKLELRRAFGDYDLTLRVRPILEDLDDDLETGRTGLALMRIAEQLDRPDLDPGLRTELGKRLREALAHLGEIDGLARDGQLALLPLWIEQIVEIERSLDRGRRLACWLLTEVAGPLASGCGSWLELALERLALTASNHLGDVLEGRRHAARIDEFLKLPVLAGRWEHAPLLIEALLAKAVHAIDCFEPGEAVCSMRAVARYYDELGGLFSEALPELFPAELRSELRGKALGTLIQALLGIGGSKAWDEARAASNEAMMEFRSRSDVARQEQYRCHLETEAGALDSAREWLARSLELDPSSAHEAIGTKIGALDGPAQAFALLHWTRIGAALGRRPRAPAFDQWVRAFDRSKLGSSAWCSGGHLDYPADSILRFVAVVRAAQGNANDALSALAHLARLERLKQARWVLVAITLAANAEVAALLHGSSRVLAPRVLTSLLKDLEAVRARATNEVPALAARLSDWTTAASAIQRAENSAPEATARLAALARSIAY